MSVPRRMTMTERLSDAWKQMKDASQEQKQASNFIFYRGIFSIVMSSCTILGLLIGYILSTTNWRPNSRELAYCHFFGQLFTFGLGGLSIPFVLASTISAAGSMDFRLCLRVGLTGLFLFGAAQVISSWLGLLIPLLIKPGQIGVLPSRLFVPDTTTPLKPQLVVDLSLDLIRSFFPRNIVESTLRHYQTFLMQPISRKNASWEEYNMVGRYVEGTNFNGLIMYGMVMGLAAVKLGVYGRPLIAFCRCLSECIFYICNFVLMLGPTGVVSLFVWEIVQQENINDVLKYFHKYIICILLGYAIWLTLVLTLLRITTKRSPLRFLKDLIPAILLAFGTSSSLQTVPVTLICLDSAGVSPRVSRFLAPVGGVVGVVGVALRACASGILTFQYLNFPVTITDLVNMSIFSPVATYRIVGNSTTFDNVLKLLLLLVLGRDPRNVENLSKLLDPVEWISLRLATVSNTITIAAVITIVSHFYRKELDELPDYNAILKEGLIFKRLSLLKTSVLSGDGDHESINAVRQKLEADAAEPDLPPAERKRRTTIKVLTELLLVPSPEEIAEKQGADSKEKQTKGKGTKSPKSDKSLKKEITSKLKSKSSSKESKLKKIETENPTKSESKEKKKAAEKHVKAESKEKKLGAEKSAKPESKKNK